MNDHQLIINRSGEVMNNQPIHPRSHRLNWRGIALGLMAAGMSFGSGSAFAAEVAPATQPSVQGPSVKGASSESHLVEGRVLVLEFWPISVPQEQQWIGRSLQQSVMTELSKGQWEAIDTNPSRNYYLNGEGSAHDWAIGQAKLSSASVVVQGSFAINDKAIRFTGQVIDVRTGKPLGGIVSTGYIRQLFQVQDDFAAQVSKVLANQSAAATSNPPATPPAAMPAPAVSARDVTGPDTTYADRQPTNRQAVNLPPERAATPYAGSDLQRAVNSNGRDLGTYRNTYSTGPNPQLYPYSSYGYPSYQWTGYYGFPLIYGGYMPPIVSGSYDYVYPGYFGYGYWPNVRPRHNHDSHR